MPRDHKPARSRAATLAAASLPLLALLAAGCAEKPAAPAATQTAAKVNKEEITVHQVNFMVGQQRGLRPEQAESASKQALERLV
ncbi:MAG: hypothetical protein ACKO6D_02880, partial [Rubrivivax sp.]